MDFVAKFDVIFILSWAGCQTWIFSWW